MDQSRTHRPPQTIGPLAVLGHPIDHSLSPTLHNAALEALGLPASYVACDVEPRRLEQAVRGLVALGFRGANVTIPHKERLLPLLDALTDRARAVGAVNTVIINRDGEKPTTLGDNTDVPGFLAPLADHADRIRGKEIVVWGAGGAARAVVYGLLTELAPRRITVTTRRSERARSLIDAYRDDSGATELTTCPWPADPAVLARATLLVNTTPLGMTPDEAATPCPDAAALGPSHLVYDLVYRPATTRLMHSAGEQGATVIGGLPMLIAQAAASFEAWVGRPMPIEAVRQALAAFDPAAHP